MRIWGKTELAVSEREAEEGGGERAEGSLREGRREGGKKEAGEASQQKGRNGPRLLGAE